MPAGIPIAAWLSFPAIFWKSLRLHDDLFAIVLICFTIFFVFSGGRKMVKFSPSRIQPNISFWYDHVPSPANIFFSEMGSPPFWFVIAVGGKMLCMPCKMALDS